MKFSYDMDIQTVAIVCNNWTFPKFFKLKYSKTSGATSSQPIDVLKGQNALKVVKPCKIIDATMKI